VRDFGYYCFEGWNTGMKNKKTMKVINIANNVRAIFFILPSVYQLVLRETRYLRGEGV